jgi:hypothetical protein
MRASTRAWARASSVARGGPTSAGFVVAAAGEVGDRGFGESEIAQTAHDVHAPEGVLVEEAIAGGTVAAGVDQDHVLLWARQFDRHAGAAGQIPDGHDRRFMLRSTTGWLRRG